MAFSSGWQVRAAGAAGKYPTGKSSTPESRLDKESQVQRLAQARHQSCPKRTSIADSPLILFRHAENDNAPTLSFVSTTE